MRERIEGTSPREIVDIITRWLADPHHQTDTQLWVSLHAISYLIDLVAPGISTATAIPATAIGESRHEGLLDDDDVRRLTIERYV